VCCAAASLEAGGSFEGLGDRREMGGAVLFCLVVEILELV